MGPPPTPGLAQVSFPGREWATNRIDAPREAAQGPAMQRALIVGASRGIGLGLAQELAQRGWHVTGTVRDSGAAGLLSTAGAAAEMLDVTDPNGPASLRARLEGQAFDLLIVNAGIAGPEHQSAEQATADEIAALFITNAIGPVRIARGLLDLMTPGSVVAFTTSRMGSVALNTAGDMELYRASKAALNSLTRSMAAKLDRPVTVLSLHPGWVRTDMGGEGADLDVQTSVRGLLDAIEERRRSGQHGFVDHVGAELAW